MRILMLSPHPTVRGPLPKHTPVLVAALREAGCEVLSVPWGRHGDADSLRDRLWSRIGDLRGMRKLAQQESFDVLVVKTSHEWVSLIRDLPLVIATRRSSPCIVLQFHGGQSERLAVPGSWLFKVVTRTLLRLVDGVLFLSSDEVRAVAKFHTHGRFHVVINPFLPSQAAQRAAPERTPRDHPATILFVGRLIEEKGVFDALLAVSLLRERLPVRLVIVGSGPASDALEQRARSLGMARDEVELTGEIGGERLNEIYAACDVFVLPTYWVEGFPTVISEAMDAGLPIVTTRIRGMADHLIEGRNALFVPPRAPEDLAAAIERLLRDPGMRERMGEANKEKVMQFAPQVAAERYIEALTDIRPGARRVRLR